MEKDGIELLAEACVNAELDIDYTYDKYYIRGFIRGYIEARDPAREERTKLITQLDICRESLKLSVARNDALEDLLKSIRPYIGQIQIPYGSLFMKEIKQMLKK